jgi:hypothetical protein
MIRYCFEAWSFILKLITFLTDPTSCYKKRTKVLNTQSFDVFVRSILARRRLTLS